MTADDRHRAPPVSGRLYAGIPDEPLPEERFDVLIDQPGVRIERIVSTGQRSPEGFWYDQPTAEWVALLHGRASLRFEGEPEARRLEPGDWVLIPAGCRHRVESTSTEPPAVWLAVHLPEASGVNGPR